MSITTVHDFPDAQWADEASTQGFEAVLENGGVLSFPRLAFALSTDERTLLDPRVSDGKAKNISMRWRRVEQPGESRDAPLGELRGAGGSASDRQALHRMLTRYADHAEAWALRLFPSYRGHLLRGGTTYRPADISSRASAWRQDDTRLHIDAFPSNPTQGTRVLRVFSNVNPHGEPRRWRVGEGFEAHARRFLPHIPRPWPGSSWLLDKSGITKRRRTEYDHLMLQLHDRAKADTAFQRDAPQASIDFAPGTTWVVYSDQVPHAAVGGQYLLEQTLHLDPDAQQQPHASPLATLERLLGRRLR